MQTVETTSDRQLSRQIDVRAAAAAATALHNAAERARGGVLAVVLASADEIIQGVADEIDREKFRFALASPDFPAQLRGWMRELREVASAWPDSGACTLATALKLWSWTLDQFRGNDSAVDELAETLSPLIAARCFVLESVTAKSDLQIDLAHVYAAHVSALAGAACAELVFGVRRHLVWDAEGCASCFAADELDEIEAVIPGFASGAGTTVDIIGTGGSHPAKRGPCARFDGVEPFVRLRNRLDACLSGSRIARDRIARRM
jgi:hypothetical protein